MEYFDWKHDLKASLVVFLVALPLCLGIALASNAPLSAGLIAGIIGGLVIGPLSNSNVSVSGPAAGLTVIVINGISQLGSFEAFSLAVILAGLFQIIFGVIKAGVIGDYVPSAVIKGMLAAIGLILIIKQFPSAIGYSANSFFTPGVLLISIVSIITMLLWEKFISTGQTFLKFVPGALVAVLLSIAINWSFTVFYPSFSLDSGALVNMPFHGGLGEIFGNVKLPDFARLMSAEIFQVGITIAIVASLETLLCIDATDKIDPLRRVTSKDRELLAQGAGNLFSGFLGGLPLTAVIVRSSANVSAGGKSKFSAIFHGLWILACVALIPQTLNLIPLATLACILLLTGYKLTKPAYFIEMKNRGYDQLIIFCTTIGAILMTDLLKGIFIGLVVAILFELRKPAIKSVDISSEEKRSVLKFTNNVSFFHKVQVSRCLSEIPEDHAVHIEGTKKHRINIDVFDVIQDFEEIGKKKGIVITID